MEDSIRTTLGACIERGSLSVASVSEDVCVSADIRVGMSCEKTPCGDKWGEGVVVEEKSSAALNNKHVIEDIGIGSNML
ncbi:MAG: hypothetical protein MR355_11125 [Lachnospiraceae bacterium]|nr:hypothetical protein [Lachnospiraceae bacterium]